MKFCPECGSMMEGKEICECGYEVATGKVVEEIRKKHIEKQESFAKEPTTLNNNIYVDEIPKNLPPISTMNEDGVVVIQAIHQIVADSFGLLGSNLENNLYQLFKNNNMSKETFNKVLQGILDKKIEEQIKNVMEKIEVSEKE